MRILYRTAIITRFIMQNYANVAHASRINYYILIAPFSKRGQKS